MHLNHTQPFHDLVWALEHKSGWKVPQSDGRLVSEVLGDLLTVSMKQLLERLQNCDGYLNSLYSLLQLHLKQLFRNKVGKSLEKDTDEWPSAVFCAACLL